MFSVGEAGELRLHSVSHGGGWGTASDTAGSRHLHNRDFRGRDEAVNEAPSLRNRILEHSPVSFCL